jgi:hypothetical protein
MTPSKQRIERITHGTGVASPSDGHLVGGLADPCHGRSMIAYNSFEVVQVTRVIDTVEETLQLSGVHLGDAVLK